MNIIKKVLLALLLIPSLFFMSDCFKFQGGLDLLKLVHFRDFLSIYRLINKCDHVVYGAEVKKELLEDSFELPENANVWSKLWMRENGKVTQGYSLEGLNNSGCLFIENTGEADWAYPQNTLVKVKAGEIFNFEGFIKTEGKKISATMGVVLYDKDKKLLQWEYVKETVTKPGEWVKVMRRFAVPKESEYIMFRIIGEGAGKTWFDNITFRKEAESIIINKNLKPLYSLENDFLRYKFNIQEGVISVLDKRINKEWTSSNALNHLIIADVLEANERQINLVLIDTELLQRHRVSINLVQGLPEIEYEIDTENNEKFSKLEFPPIFALRDTMQFVVPLQEGMLIPRDFPFNDFPGQLRYFGWELSMAFIGVIDGEMGWMEIVETPNDFEVAKVKDEEGKLFLKNRWIPEKGAFGYKRRIKYCFFDKGSYVAIAKRYREYADGKGLLQTLLEKDSKRNGNISKLIGAVNVWYWGLEKFDLANEMKKAGVQKVLFAEADKWSIKKINKLGFLTSKYDIYQDVWPPIYREITANHVGWPEDLVLDQDGNRIKGWSIIKNEKEYPGGVNCSIPILPRLKKDITNDLKNSPYNTRFIDTVTCTPWRECYNPKHPTTRGDDIRYKMESLEFCSNDMHLVTGSENGVDCAVPYCDYFEGMMSICIGRAPGTGRDVAKVSYVKPTENFLKYQVGEKYRIPLWELVYGDCVVSTAFWGDSSNRIPEVWDKRDLFNILYGNMPLWAIRDWKHWEKYKDRFIECYKNVSPVFEKVGFEEMLTHRFISGDRNVHETTFSNNIKIIVNFGDNDFQLNDQNYLLPKKGFVVFEKNKIYKNGICTVPQL